MKIPIKLLSEHAKIPTNTLGNAGFDLYAAETVIIQPGCRVLIKTDLAMEIPHGYYGRIADRSGMGYKNGGHVLCGTIDSSYRGNIGVVLYNTDNKVDIIVNKGDRPAQIIFEKYHEANFQEVSELGTTERGEKGYGSSGGLTIISQTTTKEKVAPEVSIIKKNFQEIIDIIRPDGNYTIGKRERSDLENDYNNGNISTVADIFFDYLHLDIEDWSPQELKVISEKLNLPVEISE